MKKSLFLTLLLAASHIALLAQNIEHKSPRLHRDRPVHPKVSKILDKAEKSLVNQKSSFAMKWHLDSVDSQEYFLQSQTFETVEKIHYTYDANGRCTQEIYIVLDQQGTSFIPDRKVEFSYNQQGDIARIAVYNYNVSTASFELSGQVLHSYTNNLLTEELQQNYDLSTGTYTQSYRENHTYNNTNLSITITQMWNPTTSMWENVEKREYAYNSNNENSEIKYFEYQQAAWIEGLKLSRSFVNGRIALEIFTERILASDEPFAKIEYLYDTAGNLSDYNYYEVLDGEYVLIFLDQHQYNESIGLSEMVLPIQIWIDDYLIGKFIHQPLTSVYFDHDASSSQNFPVSRYNYFYNLREGNGIAERQQSLSDLRVFPNPANDFIAFETPIEQSFVIFDAQGREIDKGRSPSGVIDITHLSQGLYTIVVGTSRAFFVKN
jgi:hypothetical protein